MDTVFGTLLTELGQILGTELKPDHLNACRLKYATGLEVQIEIDREETQILLGTCVGIISPGRFRQDVLEQALKANNLDTHMGIFGFSKKTGGLYLYLSLPLQNLTAKDLGNVLGPFIERAMLWKTALEGNTIPQLDTSGVPKKASGMFGLA